MNKKILIVGATGMLGTPVAKQLRADGFQIRVLTRDAEKARRIFDASFEIVEGNAADAAQLGSALRECYGVHLNLLGEAEQTIARLVAALALPKNIKHLTYISGSSIAEQHRRFSAAKYKFEAEQAIHTSGVPFTIFKPTWFMESLPKFVREGRATVIGKQNFPFHWVAAADYARMVSAAYQLEHAANKTFFIYGPEAFDMGEALKRYCAARHPQIKNVSIMPVFLAGILANVIQSAELKEGVKTMAYFERIGKGSEIGKPDEANDLLGAPRITLDQWLKRQ